MGQAGGMQLPTLNDIDDLFLWYGDGAGGRSGYTILLPNMLLFFIS